MGRRRPIVALVSGWEVPSGMSKYLARHLGRYPLLTAEREVELGLAIQHRDNEDVPRSQKPRNSNTRSREERDVAYQELILSNLRLALAIAGQRQFQGRGLDQEDLTQAAFIGIMKAAEKFDPEMGYKFSTYATWWVRQSIDREIANTGSLIRLPVHVHEEITRLQVTYRALKGGLGRDPSVVDLADATGWDQRKVNLLLRSSRRLVYLHEELGDDPNFTVADLIVDDSPVPVELIDREMAKEAIEAALDTLSDREADVIRMRFGLSDEDPKTLDEIGKVYDVTRERIRQIEKKALEKLRHPTRADSLRPYVDVWE